MIAPLEIPLSALCAHTGSNVIGSPQNVLVTGSDFVTFIRRDPSNSQISELLNDRMQQPEPVEVDGLVNPLLGESSGWSTQIQLNLRRRPSCSIDVEIILYEGADQWKGRAHICSCEGGQFWSLACRDLSCIAGPRTEDKYRRPQFIDPGGIGWTPGEVAPRPPNLLSFAQLLNVIYPDLLLDEERGSPGLILVTGETSSGKTQILQRIIHKYIKGRIAKTEDESRHLITLERPILEGIESIAVGQSLPEVCLTGGLEVTRRQEGIDFEDLAEALQNALRQKPILVHVDEVRNPKEWEAVLRFAASGHLITTTAHASSVPVALGRLFRELGARTPAERGELGRALRAVMHLRPGVVETKNGVRRVKLPALWRSTPDAISALVWPGLDSLIPAGSSALHGGGASPNLREPYLGRDYFAARIAGTCFAGQDDVRDRLRANAQRWDLEEI